MADDTPPKRGREGCLPRRGSATLPSDHPRLARPCAPPRAVRWPDYRRPRDLAGGAPNSPLGRGAEELFPLPPVEVEGVDKHTGSSRTARRRRNIRRYAVDDANEAIFALNALYGCDRAATAAASPAQAAVQHRMLGAARRLRQDFVLSDPEEAARELLGPRFDYGGDGAAVVPYVEEAVSLPRLGGNTVPLDAVLDPNARDVLERFDSVMLADSEHHGGTLARHVR